ncbi:MAG TPA: hypothetical protein VGJ29_12310 [Vicinamibacterales bacterium]|jgi:hypothetical protein
MFRFIITIPLVVCASVVALAQLPPLAERDGVAYSKSTPHDAVARLQQALDRGDAKLEFDAKRGYLPSVLKQLDVPISSQGLVFSRTSLQVDHIAPWTPRAIYFNDDVYVGWAQTAPIMEIASVDPTLGPVFYSLDQAETDHPKFERQTRMCLICHDSASTTGSVPGFIVRSVFADRYGYPLTVPGMDESVTTDQTPIEQRWGGWYVTGTHAEMQHRGNIAAPKLASELPNVKAYVEGVKLGPNGNVTDLHDRFDVKRYLAPDSDIVALLVLTHQSAVHNLITAAGYQARIDGDESPRAKDAAERLVRAMLFVNEAPMAGPIHGTSAFATEFSARGPRDQKGRSLRDLDLKTRLFRYPLSYLIYSDGFDALPLRVKTYVYGRLRQILSGEDTSATFSRLTGDDRHAILEILHDTKPDFTNRPVETRSDTDK